MKRLRARAPVNYPNDLRLFVLGSVVGGRQPTVAVNGSLICLAKKHEALFGVYERIYVGID